MKKLIGIAFIFLISIVAVGVSAAEPQQGNIEQGRQLANTRCEACHGPVMLSQAGLFPSLRGQKQAYLYKQLKDFKSGDRADINMQAQAGGLTDEQMRDLTFYYSLLTPINLNTKVK
ncbi:c-type cytochrome [Shewanella psychropiezotolerans]|uniref:C-type cytochrome n=1 Tax=Shewanella psychropiezotolerans TaxID=2593655 RepID=A0ABX5WS25_9GAMM|nr:c-type cytochrome [Shewanella psychropiezotolerans]QDO81897.1 c-type cytochrome [Shewanella psychropiezotolerans]